MKIWIWSLLLISTSAFASGKLQLKLGYSLNAEKLAPQAGFAIHEMLVGPMFYHQWTGLGKQPRVGEDSVLYMVSEHGLGVHIGNVSVSGGVKLQRADQANVGIDNDTLLYTKLETKLW